MNKDQKSGVRGTSKVTSTDSCEIPSSWLRLRFWSKIEQESFLILGSTSTRSHLPRGLGWIAWKNSAEILEPHFQLNCLKTRHVQEWNLLKFMEMPGSLSLVVTPNSFHPTGRKNYFSLSTSSIYRMRRSIKPIERNLGHGGRFFLVCTLPLGTRGRGEIIWYLDAFFIWAEPRGKLVQSDALVTPPFPLSSGLRSI